MRVGVQISIKPFTSSDGLITDSPWVCGCLAIELFTWTLFAERPLRTKDVVVHSLNIDKYHNYMPVCVT